MELFGYDLNNKKTLLVLIVIFLVLGILTYAIPDPENDPDNPDVEQVTISGKHDIKLKDPYAAEAEKKDSAQIVDQEETDPYEELDELIGLTDVKKEVMSLVNFVKV